MNKNNFAPHLHTHQRDSLSKQIQDGFLIFHKEKDQYEQWDAETRAWIPLLDNANKSTFITGGGGGTTGIDDFDHFILNSLPQTVTQAEANYDWANI